MFTGVTRFEDNAGISATAPWEGVGKKLDQPESVAEAIDQAGLNWRAEKKELFLEDGTGISHKAVVRSDTQDVLGVVGPRWTPYQNADAFKWFQPFIDGKEAVFSTAGCLKKGAIVWILAKLNRDNSEIVQGDEIEKYLLLSNSHDGKLSVRVGFTPIRIVCVNTLHMAHSSARSQMVRVRHGANVQSNVDSLQDVINAADANFESTAEQYRFLASRQINSQDLNNYVKIVLGKEKVENADLATRTKNQMQDIIALVESGRGNNAPNVSGTWWAAYNGVTEWLNYNRGRNADNRLTSLWFGPNASVNKLAFETAVELAA